MGLTAYNAAGVSEEVRSKNNSLQVLASGGSLETAALEGGYFQYPVEQKLQPQQGFRQHGRVWELTIRLQVEKMLSFMSSAMV